MFEVSLGIRCFGIAIYPHQSDYCDYCSKIKLEIQGCTQKISRHLQSGNTSSEDIQELKKKKEDLEKKRGTSEGCQRISTVLPSNERTM